MPAPSLVESVQQYIRKEQVMRLAKQLPVNMIANLCVVAAFVFIYRDKISLSSLALWVVYSQVVNLYGLYLTRNCRSTNKVPTPNLVSCLHHFSSYAIADSVTLAAAMWLFFIPDGGFYNIFLITVLLGTSAGGQTSLLSHLYSAIPFSLIITIAAITRLVATGQTDYYILAGMALVFSGVLIRIAYSFNHNLIHTWRLRYEREVELLERKKIEADLRESEQRYRDIVELSPDAIIIQQDKGVVYTNDAALKMLGKETLDSVKNNSLEYILEPPIKNDQQENIKSASLSKMKHQYLEAKLRTDGGQLIDIELRGKEIDYNGAPALQLIIQNISERKRVDKMKDEFISVASHELRTPITSILGAASLIRGIRSDSLDEQQKHLINIIYNNSCTLSNLVNDILDVSKIEGGKLSLNFNSYDVNKILNEVVEDNQTYASQFQVHLALNSAISIAEIETDRLRLKQILNNLISNAIKHSPENGSIEIHASTINNELRVSIQDHGSGIPQEFEARIFNKFEQSQDNNRKVIKGTGLGLYLTKSLVEQLKGNIWYETEEGIGTTFYFTLPVKRVENSNLL